MQLGRELASDGIRMNTVRPGSILFPGGGWDSLRERDPQRVERFAERAFPFGSLGTPEKVADLVQRDPLIANICSRSPRWALPVSVCDS